MDDRGMEKQQLEEQHIADVKHVSDPTLSPVALRVEGQGAAGEPGAVLRSLEPRNLNRLGAQPSDAQGHPALATLTPLPESEMRVEGGSPEGAHGPVKESEVPDSWLARFPEVLPERLQERLPEPLMEGVEATALFAQNVGEILEGERHLLRGGFGRMDASSTQQEAGEETEAFPRRVFRFEAGPFRITHRRKAKS
jgi:hypothetical protein